MSDATDAGDEPAPEAPDWLSLDEDEELRWVGQPATISLVSAFLWGIVLLPLFGLGLVVIVVGVLTVTKTDFVVTTTTLYHKHGVLSTNIETVGLDRIQNTEYSQSFFGNQLGYGTIEISTAGSGGADLTFQSIAEPREVRDLVNRLGNTVGGGAGATGGVEPGAGAGGVEEELLEELLFELQDVNDAMANVETMLREEHGEPDPGGPVTGGADTGTTDGPAASETVDATGDDDGESTASEFVDTASTGGAAGGGDEAADGSENADDDDDGTDNPPAPPVGGDDEG